MRSFKLEACYEFFRDIIAHVHSTHNVDEFMEALVSKVREVLQAQSSCLWILNTDAGQLELKATCGSTGPGESGLHTPPDLKKTRTSFKTNGETGGFWSRHLKETAAGGIRMVMELPITIKEDLIGVIRACFAQERNLSDEDREFLVAVSRQCACALETARVFEEQHKRYDRLALQTEKLSAMGRMAAGIAHEINNPLTGIMLCSTSLRKKVPEDWPHREGLDIIIKEARRCRDIIRGLLDCSREKQPCRSEVSLDDIIHDAVCLLDNMFHLSHITVRKDLSPEVPKCFVDKDEILQVFLNILLNAVEAISERGTISLRTYVNSYDSSIICEVEDTGCGISQEDLAKIFDPFYSTKPKGTGLGLSVTYAIVKNHQGDLKVFSKKGEGTRFILELPISYQAVAELQLQG